MTQCDTLIASMDAFRSTWLWKFCRKQIKRSPLLYGLIYRIWKPIDTALYISRVYLKAPPRYPLIPLATHAEKHGCERLIPSERVITPRPQVFPKSADAHLAPSHAEYTFPAIYLTRANNALVTGSTNLILIGRAVVCHDLYDWKRDYTAEELHRKTFINAARGRISWLSTYAPECEIDRAACFTDACASNYAHWLTEVLPRINLFRAKPENRDIALIVNAELHLNLMESLRTVVGETCEILPLADKASILVHDLSILSATGYVPFERRTPRVRNPSHGIFSGQALRTLRDNLLRTRTAPSNSFPKRILVRRNSSTRVLKNAQEIEDLLVSKGFVIIEPERLTFKEQVELFSDADVIIGATGAAFANLIFCKPTTKIVIMISDHKGLSYWYWQNIACAVGNRITYVIGKCEGVFSHPHSSYTIAPADLLDAVD